MNRIVCRTRFGKDYGNVRDTTCVAGDDDDDDDDDNDVDGGGINLPLIYSHGITRYIL